MPATPARTKAAICLESKSCADLTPRRTYRVLGDDMAKRVGYVRVVDDSGSDYLYPAAYFRLVTLSGEAAKRLLRDSR
jgi:hypothetical protein